MMVEPEQRLLAALAEASAGYEGEILARTRTDERVAVYEVRADGATPGLGGGTMVVVCGMSEAPLVRRLRRAAQAGDATEVGRLLLEEHARLRSEARNTRYEPPDRVLRALAAVPVLTEVSYRGKVVAEAIPLAEGLDVVTVVLPFAGGAVDPDGFVSAHYRPRSAEVGVDVETFVVYRQPELTPLERRILERLPDADVNASVGRADLAAHWGRAAVAAAAVGALSTGAFAARELVRQLRARERDVEQVADRLRAVDDRMQLARADQFEVQDDRIQRARADEFADVYDHFERARADQFEVQDDRAQLAQVDVAQLAEAGEQMRVAQQQQADEQQQRQQQEQQQQQLQEQQQREQQQREEARQRQAEEQEQRQLQAEQAMEQADRDVGDDDDGGSIRHWIDRLENQAALQALDPRAAVATLVEIRAELVRRRALR